MNKLNKKMRDIFSNELERSRNAMQWGGLVGLLAHPIYYFVWTYLLPQPYDNLYLRLSAALFCIPPILQRYWPKRFSGYLLFCWHFCLIYALPFVCTLLTIKNSFSTMWMMTEVLAIFVMALCISAPLLLMIYLVIGILGAFLAVILTSDTPLVLSAADEANLAVLPVIIICSMVFSNAMRRALIEKNKAITALAGSIAHEMRNPLGQMQYALDYIGHLLPTPNTSRTEHVISTKTINDIYSNIAQGLTSCDRGLQVIDITLREVSRQELNPKTFEYLSAASITGKALEEYNFDSPNERNKVALHVLNDFTFKIDETSYIYIIFNLLKNALYYFKSNPNSTITITIDHQKITITDTGPGIPQHVLNKLFNNFTTAGKEDGTGLGLAYCRRTMQAFGGKISCESVVGQYSTFTLTFPPISQEEINIHTKTIFQEATPLFKHQRILVIDDQVIYHTSVRRLLNDLDCHIDGAENGRIAIKMLKEKQYDLIIMDFAMLDKDGYIITEEIRAGIVPHQKNIPILAHTSELPHLAKIKTQKIGMDGFVGKTCTQLELIKAICHAMVCANSFEKTVDYITGKTILIVDDELVNRQYLEIYTNEWGMNALHADNGQVALEMLKKTPHVDIVFMDMEMPILNGVETAQRIRANPAHQHLIIIALTGNFSEQSIEEAKASGMDDFILKPFDKIVLQQKLIFLITAREQQSEKIHTHPQPKISHQKKEIGSINDTVINIADPSSNRYIPTYTSQEEFFKDLPLIDYARLKISQSDFKDKFQEFLQRFLNKLLALDNDLQTGVNNKDIKGILKALHSLVGATGYVGAHALHQYIKLRLYSALGEGHMPDEEAWVETVHALVKTSVAVLRRDWIEK